MEGCFFVEDIFDLDCFVVFLDDVVGQGKFQVCFFVDWFGGKKWIENFDQIFFFNVVVIVVDFDDQFIGIG